jgi:hypothetical protein
MSILVHKLNLRPRRSDAMHIPDDLWIAIERCWSADPELRLSLDELNQVFDGLSPEVRSAHLSELAYLKR